MLLITYFVTSSEVTEPFKTLNAYRSANNIINVVLLTALSYFNFAATLHLLSTFNHACNVVGLNVKLYESNRVDIHISFHYSKLSSG